MMSIGCRPWVRPDSLTSSSCDSVSSRTLMASWLWSAALAMAAEQMPISRRSRLLSLTMRM